jgi:hypothetical protein
MLLVTFFVLLFRYLQGVNCNDTTESTPAMPQVYTDITFSEFLQKVSPNTTLYRRDVVGGEENNSDLVNAMLNTLHGICVDKCGEGYRASSAFCNGNSRRISCRTPGTTGTLQVSKTCGPDWVCLQFYAVNFNNEWVKFCQCAPRTNINQRIDIETKLEYEGYLYSPGSHTFFAEAGKNWKLDWDYVSTSFKSEELSAHTWACAGCPPGRLTMTHYNSPAHAGVFYSDMSFI